MSIRVDPRRLSLLKELAAAEGLRPGQLVQRWIEERLDSERTGGGATPTSGDARVAALESSLAALVARIDEVTQRLQRVESPLPGASATLTDQEQESPRRKRGRPPKAPGTRAPSSTARGASRNGRVSLHDEIIAVIRERGPSTAAELATAIRERGLYAPPRSAKPFDAATVNGRVSNPVYRARFKRSEGRISLAD
jgi:hypothetical protein